MGSSKQGRQAPQGELTTFRLPFPQPCLGDQLLRPQDAAAWLLSCTTSCSESQSLYYLNRAGDLHIPSSTS